MMMRGLLAAGMCAVALLLMSSDALAEDEINFLLGKIESGAVAGTSVSDLCYTSGAKYLKADETIFITGKHSCSKYSINRTFLEFTWKGETYYLEEDKIFLTDENKAKMATLSEADWIALRSNGKYVSLLWQKTKAEKLLAVIESMRSNGAIIADWGLTDESEYTKGTGLRFEVLNPTQRTIKYVWITVAVLNPVGDPAGPPRTVKLVGPIEPDTSGSYSFDYVWMSDMPSTAKIRAVKIQYMDGSIRNVAAPSKMIFSDDETAMYKDFSSQ